MASHTPGLRALATSVVAVLAIAACSAAAASPPTSDTSAPSRPSAAASPASSAQVSTLGPVATRSPDPGAIVGIFDIGGRSLHLACVGRGSPTIILEPGDGDPTSLMSPLRDALSSAYRVCLYDRAGKTGSDPAATPRPARQLADDLGRLLDVAKVPGPFLPVGTSLGGTAAYLFAATHPDDVVGFVSINPPPNPEDWLPAVKPLITDREYADEVSAGDGTGDAEGIDERGWLDVATPPDDMPYLILDSGPTQCEGDQLCLKVYDVIVDQTKDIASRGAAGRWMQVAGSHQLQLSNPDDVLPLIRQLADGQMGS